MHWVSRLCNILSPPLSLNMIRFKCFCLRADASVVSLTIVLIELAFGDGFLDDFFSFSLKRFLFNCEVFI